MTFERNLFIKQRFCQTGYALNKQRYEDVPTTALNILAFLARLDCVVAKHLA